MKEELDKIIDRIKKFRFDYEQNEVATAIINSRKLL
jgi:hypothetical protein